VPGCRLWRSLCKAGAASADPRRRCVAARIHREEPCLSAVSNSPHADGCRHRAHEPVPARRDCKLTGPATCRSSRRHAQRHPADDHHAARQQGRSSSTTSSTTTRTGRSHADRRGDRGHRRRTEVAGQSPSSAW
jgi:hypothetical protein